MVPSVLQMPEPINPLRCAASHHAARACPRPLWLSSSLLLSCGSLRRVERSLINRKRAYCDITEEPRRPGYLQLSNGDLYRSTPGWRKDPAATIDETRAGMDRIVSYLAARIAVTNHGQVCLGEPLNHAITKTQAGFSSCSNSAAITADLASKPNSRLQPVFRPRPTTSGLCRASFGGESEHHCAAELHARPRGVR